MSIMLPTTIDTGSVNVPAFLTKLWVLVDDSESDDLIAWDASGKSFHVYDQAIFSKEILPLYFKHNNIASFIRQLNMYGFRKVMNIEQGTLKVEKDDLQFQHPYFQRDQQHLLEHIKRKGQMMKVPALKTETPQVEPEQISKVVGDVKQLKGKQDTMNSKLDSMKRENEALWRELASLRQKHMKQQTIVNKLIQFLVSVVGGNTGIKTTNLPKRKMPLMLNDASQIAAKSPKYSSLSVANERPSDLYTVQSPDSKLDLSKKATGPIIHDVTDLMVEDNGNIYNIDQEDEILPVLVPGFEDPTDDHEPPSLVSNTVTENRITPSQISTPEVDLKTPKATNPFKNFSAEKLLKELSHHSSPVDVSSKEDVGSVSQFISSQVAAPTSKDVVLSTQSEFSTQLDNTQKDIEGLKDLLGNSLCSVDLGSLSDIFDILPESIQVNPNDGNNIVGNELIEYTGPPSENLFFDMNTLSTSNSIDQLQSLIDIDDDDTEESSKT